MANDMHGGAFGGGGSTLTIDKATIGYDKAGMEQVYKDIKTNLIEDVINKLDTNVPTLRDHVDTYWIGASADAFKAKVENDTEIVKKRLREVLEGLESEINQMMYNVNNSDASLAQDIKTRTVQ